LLPAGSQTVVNSISAQVPPALRKEIYKNDYAFFQFYPGRATAYFTLWHRVTDPHDGCTTVVARTYLSPMLAVTVNDSRLKIWQNTDEVPHPIEWGFSKYSHDGCHYCVYYRIPGGEWHFYGNFEVDYPR
jgi:hypothetical protein